MSANDGKIKVPCSFPNLDQLAATMRAIARDQYSMGADANPDDLIKSVAAAVAMIADQVAILKRPH